MGGDVGFEGAEEGVRAPAVAETDVLARLAVRF